jgi:hypothetical protein
MSFSIGLYKNDQVGASLSGSGVSVAYILANPACFRNRFLAAPRLAWPEHRCHEGNNDRDDERERHADPDEVPELIAAGSID